MLIRHLLRYLLEHPGAKDTLQGILQWWLPRGRGERGEEEVQEALDELVARGWLTRRQPPPSQTLYGVNREKLEEIKAFVRERESATDGYRQ
jgi:hypothetical protein